MRIISGTAKSRRLKTVPDTLTRPTADRVKESIFNILGKQVVNARVMDLFAGSGNLGLESLSRGASFAVFVDQRPACTRIIRENSKSLVYDKQTEIMQGDVFQVLRRMHDPFDLIFIDPPYLKDMEIPVLELLARNNLLSEQGIIILEHHKKTILDKGKIPFSCIREKVYGDTMVSFLKNRL